jgi:hypothetical protein
MREADAENCDAARDKISRAVSLAIPSPDAGTLAVHCDLFRGSIASAIRFPNS